MIGYTFKFRGLFLSSLVVVHMDFRMRLDRNIKLMWEPAGERKDIGSFPTHCSRWIVFICQSITKQNEENFPQFSSLQTFAFLCLPSQQLIVPKLPKVVIASCLFRFRHSQTQFGKWLYQSQVLKFAKGSPWSKKQWEKFLPLLSLAWMSYWQVQWSHWPPGSLLLHLMSLNLSMQSQAPYQYASGNMVTKANAQEGLEYHLEKQANWKNKP